MTSQNCRGAMNSIAFPRCSNIKSELQRHKNVPARRLQCQGSLVTNTATEIDGIEDILPYNISPMRKCQVGIAEAGWMIPQVEHFPGRARPTFHQVPCDAKTAWKGYTLATQATDIDTIEDIQCRHHTISILRHHIFHSLPGPKP